MTLNQTYQIEIQLLSEAIFASGEKERNLAQSKVLTDQYGFVYFHAKSLKGQLKKQAFWLYKQYEHLDPQHAATFLQSLAVLFGINKLEMKHYAPKFKKHDFPTQGIMRLSNLELPESVRRYYIELLSKDRDAGYSHLSSHDLIEAQTELRTAIQLEDGVTKDQMFTTYQAVKKGLIFYSTITFVTDSINPKDDLNPINYIEDLLRILGSMTRIGAGVHRGRGKIEARLLQEGKKVSRQRGERHETLLRH
ncbi:RAMP superfamily CRISPR-associated protein [Sporosarcina limicola]|uniref:CRISPR type III-associated protein domain-containing protein n=1 Tax=Sporosarcina limicola TaxID=34101 RepID=A0A927MK42_9BACL|nr:RAMP superfamily CRISPR-associated protein [Sporosarcina limicola]MBE1555403.1 hypothetical protein [Sporosarcina limicola]